MRRNDSSSRPPEDIRERTKSLGGTLEITMAFPDRKKIDAMLLTRLVRDASTSSQGTSNSYPKNDSFVPGALETAVFARGTGVFFVNGTFHERYRVSKTISV